MQKLCVVLFFYDINGRLTLEPLSESVDDICDNDKKIVWDFSSDKKDFLGYELTYNFEKVYNDVIVLGNITNGYQAKARVQNKNPLSNTCVGKIGLKTITYEDNQYVTDSQCEELAQYYAKLHTILQKSGNINSLPKYHLDVNKLITLSTPKNDMSKELFLITGYSLNSISEMSISVTSVNDIKSFSVISEGD